MPCLAECGGFMYLHEELEDRDGNVYPMAGVIKGKTYPTGKLVRFGYVNITADKEADWLLPGETIKGHEFHYWDSTDAGTDCMAVKPDGKRKWNCIHMRENLFAGYPHLYLPSHTGIRPSVRRALSRVGADAGAITAVVQVMQ